VGGVANSHHIVGCAADIVGETPSNLPLYGEALQTSLPNNLCEHSEGAPHRGGRREGASVATTRDLSLQRSLACEPEGLRGSFYPKQAPTHERYPAQHLPQHHRAHNGCEEGKGIDKPYRQRCNLEPQARGGADGHVHDVESIAAARHILREGGDTFVSALEDSEKGQHHRPAIHIA
jgi:hypothetical protein